MHTYIAKVGRQPELAIAELINTFAEAKSCFWLVSQQFIQFDSKTEITTQDFNKLGMIPELYKLINTYQSEAEVLETPITINKKNFAIDFTQIDVSDQFKKQVLKAYKNLNKKRYLNQAEKPVSNAYIIAEGFFKKNVTKITLLTTEAGIHALETIHLQDINNYSKRDFKKPARDMKRGMFPPKLAQLLINLAKQNQPIHEALYDPFCGIGTVAIEAALQGIPSLNSDIDPRAVYDTERNLLWLNREETNSSTHWSVFKEDATILNTPEINWEDINTIVTEGYLGNIVNKPITTIDELHDHKHIMEIYSEFLTALTKKLTKSTTIILCVPCYQTQSEQNQTSELLFYEKVVEKMRELGYNPNALIPGWLKNRLNIKTTSRNTLVYIRPKQKVGREIFSLTYIPG
jgi:tRNA G10  N-methylase Trm11